MAYEVNELRSSFLASTGLKQYQCVAINSAGVLVNPASTLGLAHGILTSSGTTGSTGRAGSTTSGVFHTIQFGGIAKVLSGSSSIAIGDMLKPETDGRVTVGSATGAVIGIALSAGVSTSTVSEVISVLLFPFSGVLN
ncbi:MAG: hypothetical protein L0Z49_11190 [Actinobacteria bacterium]|nr:hypothetical protein [Actinomycetota bacterium]